LILPILIFQCFHSLKQLLIQEIIVLSSSI
jgi:hypothetical protein